MLPNQLVSDHTELKRDVLKLRSMLEAKSKRIRDLEVLLKGTREAANQEYHRLQQEREKTRMAFMNKLKDRESERPTMRVHMSDKGYRKREREN